MKFFILGVIFIAGLVFSLRTLRQLWPTLSPELQAEIKKWSKESVIAIAIALVIAFAIYYIERDFI